MITNMFKYYYEVEELLSDIPSVDPPYPIALGGNDSQDEINDLLGFSNDHDDDEDNDQGPTSSTVSV